MKIGEILRRIRSDGKWTLGDVESKVKIKKDYLSKIETNKRSPSEEIIQKLSKFYGVDEIELLDLFHISRIKESLNYYSNSLKVLETLTQMEKNKSFEVSIPTPSNVKAKGSPIFKGTKYGKVKGFNYYVQSTGKLKKKDRNDLIKKSDHYYSRIQNMIGNNSGTHLVQLDEKMNDDELVQQWNEFYDKFGYQFSEFREEIMREKINSHTSNLTNKSNIPIDDLGFDSTQEIDF